MMNEIAPVSFNFKRQYDLLPKLGFHSSPLRERDDPDFRPGIIGPFGYTFERGIGEDDEVEFPRRFDDGIDKMKGDRLGSGGLKRS